MNGSIVAGPGAAGVIVIHAPTSFEGGGIISRRSVFNNLLPIQLMNYLPEDGLRQPQSSRKPSSWCYWFVCETFLRIVIILL
jgi:hypothetical protein